MVRGVEEHDTHRGLPQQRYYECLHYRQVEDGRIGVLVTNVDSVLRPVLG